MTFKTKKRFLINDIDKFLLDITKGLNILDLSFFKLFFMNNAMHTLSKRTVKRTLSA